MSKGKGGTGRRAAFACVLLLAGPAAARPGRGLPASLSVLPAGAALEREAGSTGGDFSFPDLKAQALCRYRLRGEIAAGPDGARLRSSGGREFELDLTPAEARLHSGRRVELEGMARQGDQTSSLTVLSVVPAPAADAPWPPFAPDQRPARITARDSDSLVVDDVRWGRTASAGYRWAAATLKPARVSGVYLVRKPFPPEALAAHSMLLFRFDEGGMADPAGQVSDGLAFSIEARLPKGEAYDPLKGLRPSYGIVYNLTTWQEQVDFAASGGRTLYLYPLRLSRSQASALLLEVLDQASVDRTGEFYNTLYNNCTGNLVILLNRVLPGIREVPIWDETGEFNVLAATPNLLPDYLKEKGLAGDPLPPISPP